MDSVMEFNNKLTFSIGGFPILELIIDTDGVNFLTVAVTLLPVSAGVTSITTVAFKDSTPRTADPPGSLIVTSIVPLNVPTAELVVIVTDGLEVVLMVSSTDEFG